MTKSRSVKILNKDIYTYRLELDDIKGIIRLTKNKSTKDTTRITDRNIPITTDTKWEFHNNRSGYSEKPSDMYKFIGSYIDRNKDFGLYNWWKNYIVSTYKALCIKEGIEDEETIK